MATVIRPELSKNNKYWIPKHRFYELKHFCMQYPEWKKAYADTKYVRTSVYDDISIKSSEYSDPTYKLAEQRILYFNKMLTIEKAAKEADPELDSYILKGVTEGYSYVQLRVQFEIPCGKDTYYDRYRRFFWILDQKRD